MNAASQGLILSLRRVGWIGALSVLLLGCFNRSKLSLQAPSDVPPYTIDVEASEVRTVGSVDAEDLRNVGASALAGMTTPGGAPARFKATVQSETMPNALHATVELRLWTTKGVFEGRGESVHASLGTDLETWRATVHDAFQNALANAFGSGVLGEGPTP
ncbi:MAG TPA: hypothetical protein VJU61_03610 [Polyangiaceae bacterium]|nr:hypothetical protein [Polyangiaceae bacterium]